MKVYKWRASRLAGGEGLGFVQGQVDAWSSKQARVLIERELADYAKQGLVRGPYLLTVRNDKQMLTDRTIQIESNHPHPLPNVH